MLIAAGHCPRNTPEPGRLPPFRSEPLCLAADAWRGRGCQTAASARFRIDAAGVEHQPEYAVAIVELVPPSKHAMRQISKPFAAANALRGPSFRRSPCIINALRTNGARRGTVTCEQGVISQCFVALIRRFDTVKNTVSRFGLVLDEDSNRCELCFGTHCTSQVVFATMQRSSIIGHSG